jgi:hypothetical protein
VKDDLEGVSDHMLADQLREAAQRVKDGEEARILRGALIDEAGRRGWKQEDIAKLAAVKQQAVSKRLNRRSSGGPTSE